jgi:uncharacterized membrane protein
MVYNFLKILHIISAALLLISMGYSYHLWRYMQSPKDGAIRSQRIQILTGLVIVPLAIIQLATGFSMISINHEDWAQLWITGSIVGFVTVVGSWFSFLYFLLLSQQVNINQTESGKQFLFYRRLQSMMLYVCAIALLFMIFFMTNKVT